MATEKEINKIYDKAIKLAEEKKCLFIEELISYLPISKTTFYDYFKLYSDDLKNIKHIIDTNTIKKKHEIRKNIKVSKRTSNLGYLYVVKCADFNYYKIGISRLNYFNRLSTMQTSNPFELKLIYVFHCINYSELEHVLHNRYINNNIRGEWFELSNLELKNMIAYININITSQSELEF